MRRATTGTALIFTASGVIQASWASRLPALSKRIDEGFIDLGLTPYSFAHLGLALLVMGAGSLLSMPFAGRMSSLFGSHRVVSVASVTASLTLVALAAVSWLPALLGVMFGFGAAAGAWDVAMNIRGAEVEDQTDRHRLPLFHGWWSLGAAAGAGIGAVAAKISIPLTAHFLVAALFGGAVSGAGLVVVRDVGGALPADNTRRNVGRRGAFIRLVPIALIALGGAAIEGAANDWLTVFLVRERDWSDATAAVGYMVFAASMAAGRFTAEYAHDRVGRVSSVRIGAALAATGVLLTVLVAAVPFAYLGALMWGAGISVAFPAAISAGGQTRNRATGVAAVTAAGYSAGLLGPPLIGALAQACGLGTALLLIPILATVVAGLAGYIGASRASGVAL